MQIPGYRIQQVIGTGSVATVYLAKGERHGEPVALKLLPHHHDGDVDNTHIPAQSQDVQRFLREIKLIRTLVHPNVVRVLDAGSTVDGLYIVMEHVTGGGLGERDWRAVPGKFADSSSDVARSSTTTRVARQPRGRTATARTNDGQRTARSALPI
jgi:serine/threonine protein kinase